MTEEIKALKSLISTWEKKVKAAEKMLSHLRAALEMAMEADASAAAALTTKKRKTAPPSPPFTTKYEKRSDDYILDVLRSRTVSLRQLQDALASSGKVYSDQAVLHTLRKLEKQGKVRKQPAPAGSAARFVFELNTQPALDFPHRRAG